MALIVLVAVVVNACSQIPVAPDAADARPADGTTTVAPDPGQKDPACEAVVSDAAWATDVSAKAVTLSEGDPATPRVEAVIYPHPDYEGRPWSQWGQGLVVDDGRFLSAIGDHKGPDGNSYVYAYDPDTQTLTQIVDVLSIVDHQPGDWGYGKIHAQMVPGPCDTVMVTTYWGTRRDIEYTSGYQGDILVSIDPQRQVVGSRGVLLPEHGIPSMAASDRHLLLYSEAVDPFGEDVGAFVAYDAETGETVFVDNDPSHTGFRAIAVDAEGRAYYSLGEGSLAIYDPESNARTQLEAELPGEWLRAATMPDRQGTLYGVTRFPEVFFALDPDGSVRTLGDALGYTASVALSPDGTTIYWVPEAHGDAWAIGAPLMAMDTQTGDATVVVELQPLAEQLGLRLGGTYSVAVDRTGRTAYVGMNASELADDSGFGEVVLLIVTLP